MRRRAWEPHLLTPWPRTGQVVVGLDLGPLAVHQVARAGHRRLTRGLVLPSQSQGQTQKLGFEQRAGPLLKHVTQDKKACPAREK